MTTKIEKSPEKKRLEMEAIRKDMEILLKEFPKAFTLKNPKPLKIGIKEDIFAKWGDNAPMSKLRFGKALQGYVNTKSYLRAFATEQHRYDLEGKKVQEITEANKTHAATALEKREGKNKEK